MVIAGQEASLGVPPGAFGEGGDDVAIGMAVTNNLKKAGSGGEEILSDVVDFTVPDSVPMPFATPVVLTFPNSANISENSLGDLCCAYHDGEKFVCESDVSVNNVTNALEGKASHFTAYAIVPKTITELPKLPGSSASPQISSNLFGSFLLPIFMGYLFV